jgi:hypothetical protein
VEALNQSRFIDPSFKINTKKFNKAMGKDGSIATFFDGSNSTGIFQVTYHGKKYYYITKPGQQVAYPRPLDSVWQRGVLDVASKIFEEPATRSSQQRKNVAFADDDSNARKANDADDNNTRPHDIDDGRRVVVLDTPQQPRKRPRENEFEDQELLPGVASNTTTSYEEHHRHAAVQAVTPAAHVEGTGGTTSSRQQPTYWQSPEAQKLFKPCHALDRVEATCPVKHLTKDLICKFAARARAYICTYYCLENADQQVVNEEKKQVFSFDEIQKLMKDFKAHRCALDFDRGFVTAELKKRST